MSLINQSCGGALEKLGYALMILDLKFHSPNLFFKSSVQPFATIFKIQETNFDVKYHSSARRVSWIENVLY